MQLNHDCIRDLLLYLEDHTGIYRDEETRAYTFFEVTSRQLLEDEHLTTEYSEDEIMYSLLKLKEADMLAADEMSGGANMFRGITVTDITWGGHEFLGNIRDDTVWNKTKEKAMQLGISSVKGLATLAWKLFLATISNPQLLASV